MNGIQDLTIMRKSDNINPNYKTLQLCKVGIVLQKTKKEKTMETMRQTKTPASRSQKKQFMTVLIEAGYDLLEDASHERLQYLLSQVGKTQLRVDIRKILNIKIDPWAIQKANLERFWKALFPEYVIDWENNFANLPEYSDRYPHLNIMPAGFTAEQIFAAIKNCKAYKFKKRNKYYDDIDKALREAKAVQSRPTGNYAFADGGTDEPDQEHLNKSYDDSVNTEIIFMGPIEYLLSCALYEFLTGKVYDVKGLTRLSVLDSGGGAMDGRWYSVDGSYLGWYYRDSRDAGKGPRVVVFYTT